MVKGTITPSADGTVRFTATCMLCDKPCAVDRLDPEKVARWQAGEFVQDVFPELSAAEREVLVSGSHAECFDAAFPADADDNDQDTSTFLFGTAPRGWPADGSDSGRYDFPNLGSPGPDRDSYREW